MRRPRSQAALFSALIGIFWFSLYTYVPVLSVYAESLGVTKTMIGLILGSYGLMQVLLRLPVGLWSDRVNRRKSFVVAGTVFALAGALGMAYFKSEAGLLVFRGLTGAASATWVAYTVMYSSYFSDKDTSRAIGTVNAVSNAGQVAGIFFGGLVAGSFGYESAFLLAAAAAFIGLLIGSGVRETADVARKPESIRSLLSLFRHRSLMVVSGMAILSQLVTFATVYGFSPIIAKGLGADSFQLGMLTMVSSLPAIAGSYFSGTLVLRKLGGRYGLAASFALTAASTVVIPFLPNLALLFVTQFVGNFGRGVIMPLLMAASISHVEEGKRATAMGFFQAVYAVGIFIGPTVVGLFGSSAAGLTSGFLAASAFALVGMVLSLVLISGENRVVMLRPRWLKRA
jgi:MFS family permease